MVSPSNRVARLATVKMEACTTEHAPGNEEIRRAEFDSSPEAAKADEDEICYLSGKPYFDIIIGKTHLNRPRGLYPPISMTQRLPRATIPAVLRHRGKTWNMSYCGDAARPRFDYKWKAFVADNHLKVGDGCVFELMESDSRNAVFKVMIVRGEIPPELQALIDSRGKSEAVPIVID
ncbi:hypothetical protein ABFX02_14G161700 [Erythranthe guttata]